MKKIINLYIRFVQKILITILLTIVYFIVFGITKLVMFIFPGKHLKRLKKMDTYWLDAEGYTADINSAMEQS